MSERVRRSQSLPKLRKSSVTSSVPVAADCTPSVLSLTGTVGTLRRRSSSLHKDSVFKVAAQIGGYHSAHVSRYLPNRDPRWRAVCPPLLKDDRVSCIAERPIQFLWYKYDCIAQFPDVPACGGGPPACLAKASEEQLEAANVTRIGIDRGVRGSGQPTCLSDNLKQLAYHRIKFPSDVCIVGCFEDASAVWKKHLLWRNMKTWCSADPVARGDPRDRLPHTFSFDLNDPGALQRCEAYFAPLGDTVQALICKHSTGANGKGIKVCPNLFEAMVYITSDGAGDRKGGANDWWVIQEFVMRSPLVFENRRFHMRMHVVATVTPYSVELFAFHKTRVQVCNEEFNPETFCEVPDAVVSNWAMQKKNKRFNTKTFYHMLEDLCETYPQLVPVLPAARQIVCDAFCAALTTGRENFKFQMGCFEVLGFDFIVEGPQDGPWRPLLLEGNHRPGFAANRKFIEGVFSDTIALVMYPVYPIKGDSAESIYKPWIHIHSFIL